MSFQNEDSKLDWMYKGATSLVDREEYLLGRRIDKTLETLNEEEKQKDFGITQPKNHVEHECIPPSIRDYNKIQLGEQQVDLATKLQEDPLVAIKKREEETRKQFLQNPIQLKKLQSALDKQLKKKKKKSKKSKRNDDIDFVIAEKLKNLKSTSIDLSSLAPSTSCPDDKDFDKQLLKKFRKFKNHLSENDFEEILESKNTSGKEEVTSKESDSEDDRNYKSRNKTNYDRKNSHQNWDRNKTKRKEITQQPFSVRQNRITEEEKERRRREMMDNAKWRDVERTNNVRRYREEDDKETKTQKDFNPEFIHKELMRSANNSSVESRIKSNINNIQRSKGVMDKHFSKRT